MLGCYNRNIGSLEVQDTASCILPSSSAPNPVTDSWAPKLHLLARLQ